LFLLVVSLSFAAQVIYEGKQGPEEEGWWAEEEGWRADDDTYKRKKKNKGQKRKAWWAERQGFQERASSSAGGQSYGPQPESDDAASSSADLPTFLETPGPSCCGMHASM
jgi:hypothetical protein